MKTYRVYFGDGESQDVEARGFTVNNEGQLMFKVQKEGGIVAMFADKKWDYFFVVSDGTDNE
jgi:hypothetical protein